MLERVWQALQQIALLDVLDIIIVYYVIYRLLLLIRIPERCVNQRFSGAAATV